jgi:hypothetical protein
VTGFSRTTTAVGQGEAETGAVAEIAMTEGTEMSEVIQTVSRSIDRSDPVTVIDLTVLSVLRKLTVLTVLIIPAVGEIVSQCCNSSSNH